MRSIAPVLTRLACAVVACGLMMGVIQADDKKSDPPAKKAQDDAEKPKQAKKVEKSPEQRAATAKRQFKRRDKNQDGSLTVEEFVIMPKKLTDEAKIERRKKAMNRQFKLRDADGDGKLSLDEFAKPVARKKQPGTAKKKKAGAAKKKAQAKKSAKKKAKQAQE